MTRIFLAATGLEDDPLPGFGPITPAVKERLIVIAAMLFVLFAVMGWALLLRSQRRRSARREDRHHRRHSFAKTAAKGVAEIREYVKKPHRRRRREHRPRNPTLAETGGLPPVRDEDNQPPQSQPH